MEALLALALAGAVLALMGILRREPKGEDPAKGVAEEHGWKDFATDGEDDGD